MESRPEGRQKRLREMNEKVRDDPQRPVFHFLPPAYWMNDPNGPIFYKGEYHLFYQFNPDDDKWGNIHWGHAKSKDLMYWEHLPIALKPSQDKNEMHCFSGDCIINEGIPTIIYTSIGPDKLPKDGAEQWMAKGDEQMIRWEKSEKNPIMTLDIHETLEIEDWRDPFIWKEKDSWYAVLGGHLTSPTRPTVLLYTSKDLYKWEFVNPLVVESRKRGKNWECPNFFQLSDKHMLIVSPHKRVIYSIGDYKNKTFNADQWNILDYGKCYYATNVLDDKRNERKILFGWIQGSGDVSGWNGCLSLPRVIDLDPDEELLIKPLPKLEKIRKDHFQMETQIIEGEQPIFSRKRYESTLEIKAKIKPLSSDKFGITLYPHADLGGHYSIGFDSREKRFWAGKEKANIDLLEDRNFIKLQIFIDHSVFEVYINEKICLTSRIFLNKKEGFYPIISTASGRINLMEMDAWTIKSIW